MDSDFLRRIDRDESFRQTVFPACRQQIFLGHAGVAPIPQAAVDAMTAFNIDSATGELDYGEVFLSRMDRVRKTSADFLGGSAEEYALLGPTSLGLSLVANGLDWQSGDEIIYYPDDYPANVYPWTHLEARGVRPVPLSPQKLGEITPELVQAAITSKTRLIALASCHFLSGYRLDIAAISDLAHEHGILFSLDAIQTAGAFPIPLKNVDFFSADSHKWLLGPSAAGVVYVKKERQEILRPCLYGAWNVVSPNFISQDQIDFEPGARRYEPGVLNAAALLGMEASIRILAEVGIDAISHRLLDLKSGLCKGLEAAGFEMIGPREGTRASSITTCTDRANPARVEKAYVILGKSGIFASLRHDRSGTPHIRFSPHFYNTHAEIDQTLRVLRNADV